MQDKFLSLLFFRNFNARLIKPVIVEIFESTEYAYSLTPQQNLIFNLKIIIIEAENNKKEAHHA